MAAFGPAIEKRLSGSVDAAATPPSSSVSRPRKSSTDVIANDIWSNLAGAEGPRRTSIGTRPPPVSKSPKAGTGKAAETSRAPPTDSPSPRQRKSSFEEDMAMVTNVQACSPAAAAALPKTSPKTSPGGSPKKSGHRRTHSKTSADMEAIFKNADMGAMVKDADQLIDTSCDPVDIDEQLELFLIK